MSTKEIFRKHNQNLMLGLIPKGNEPIYCNRVLDDSEAFNNPIKDL